MSARTRGGGPRPPSEASHQESLRPQSGRANLGFPAGAVLRHAPTPCRALGLALAGVILASPCTPALAEGPGDHLGLATLAEFGHVEVSLDASRFARSRTATIRIVSRRPFAIEGRLAACESVFRPEDPAFSGLRPAESGNFRIGAKQTIELTRPFRLVDASKRPPGSATYRFDAWVDAEPGCRD